MNEIDTRVPRLEPTEGQLAVAQAIADGHVRSADRIETVPARVYTDPDQYLREKGAIFDRLPQVLSVSALLPEPGMAVPHDDTGRQLLITRDADGEIHLFLNVCKHRGTRLIEGNAVKCGKRLVCPYHAWTYKLEASCMPFPDLTLFRAWTNLISVSSSYPVAKQAA